MVFIVSMAISCGFDFGGATCPAKITLCNESGRSIRYTADFFCCSTWLMFFLGTSPGFQPLNNFSRLDLISFNVASPTMMSVALFGLNQVAWNFFISDAVNFSTDDSVPEPVNGFP